jgi:O-acetyl-ADP-ribose deacetylase (regulator of RNase III)
LAIGSVQVFELKNAQTNPRYIINLPNKNHWREPSRIADIESGLQSLVAAVERYKIKSIAMPALGCGLGGLDYAEVKPLIETAFVDLAKVEVLLFVPK